MSLISTVRKLFSRRPTTMIDATINKISNIDREVFAKVYNSDMGIYSVHSYYATLEEYSDLYTCLTEGLSTDRVIYRLECPTNITIIPLTDVFLNKQGHYSDPVTIVSRYLNTCQSLITLYQELERSENRTFNFNRNAITISDVISNAISIISVLEIIDNRK